MYILKEDLMKKRVLSLFMVLVLCLTLLPTAAFAEGDDVSISGGVIGGGETGGEGGGVLVPPGGSTGEGGGIYVAPGSPTEGGGGTYIPGEDTRTEIWCVSKPDSIGRSYDGTTDGDTIPIDLTFTDGTNEIKLKEGTGFTAKKTFDSADAGNHTVTVEIELIGDAAAKYKLKAGEETFTIGGNINKAYPDLTVSLSRTTCAVGEKLLPLLSVEGAPEDAEVTYYYLASALKSWAGSSDVEGSEAMPKINENTAISDPGTYYVYAKTGETKNYEENRSATVELTVSEKVDPVVSVTTADGTETPYGSFVDAWTAAVASEGSTLKLLADGTLSGDNTDISKSITLNLNGYVLGSNGSLTVKNGAALTVKNAGAEKSEKPVKAGLYLTLLVEKGGSFTCTDGKIQYLGLQAAGTGDYAIRLAEGENHCAFGGFAQGDANATIGDLLKATPGMALYAEDAGSTVQIARSTLISKDFNYFSFYVGPCSEHQIGEDGTCDYCGASYVASVTTGGVTNNYTSLDDALNAAQNGDTVTLLSGAEITRWHSLSKAFTLELNGKTATTQLNAELYLHAQVTVQDSSTGKTGGMAGTALLNVQSNGDLTIQSGTFNGRIAINDGKLTIKGGTFNQEVALPRGDSDSVFFSGGTFAKIWYPNSSGSFLDLLADGYAFYDKNGKLVNAAEITGTYLYNVQIRPHQHTFNNGACACGYTCPHTSVDESGACTVCGYHCPHNTVDETTLSCSDCGAKVVAKVEVEGSEPTYAFDLASAFQNAVNGTTITLLANGMLDSNTYVSKTLTLDLNGHSLSGYSLNVGGLTPTSQVRTGKLTVIDSSGGNGAVGVTVRDGGTLVFDPENDHTTLLQLEVWGGTVELYGGKISRKGLQLNNNITLGDLLPQKAGLAYYRGDTQLTLEEATSQTCDLVVKSCSHGGKNGFDKDAATCPYCNAPAVAETALNDGEGRFLWRRFADLQTAIDADRDGGAEFKLLTDVTGDYTIDGTQNTALNLYGHSIKGTVTVKGIKGDYITTTLSNTENTTTASIDKVVACDGAELAGSKYPAVIGELTLAEGATWKTILNDTALGYKVLNAGSTHKWYARDDVKGSQLNNVIINSLPITSKTLYLKVDGTNVKGNKVERGTTVQLCASCNAKDANVSIYIGEIDENNEPKYSLNKAEYKKIGTSWYYVVNLDANKIGTYDIYFTATKDGYTVTSTSKKLTVTKPNLSNAEITFPYGNEAAFNSVSATGVPMFVVTYNGTKLEENVDFVITRGASTYDVGPCTLTIKATDNGDYTGSKSAEWTVRPLKVAASVGDIIKTYDGTTDLPANAKITFKSADSYYTGTTLRLAKGTDYEVSNAHYDSADASETEKTVSFTIKLKNAGYVFEDGTTQKDFTLNGADFDDKTFQINKATVPMNNPTGTLDIINGTCQTYTYDFNNILPGLPGGKYGTISYGQADISLVSQSGYYYDETIVEFKKGVLTLAQFYAKDGKMTGKIGTVKVNVTTTNYENFQLKLVLYAVDQIKPEPDGTITASEITYGDTLSKSEISGKMKDPNTGDAVNGTFTWTDGTIKPDANDNYEAEWTFTPAAGYEKYATVIGTVTIKVAPKSIEGATITLKKREFTYNAAEQSPTITGVMLKGWSETITTYDIVSGDKAINANDSITLTIKGTGNYTGTATAEWKIIPAKLTVSVPSEVKKEYDGTTNATVTPTFNGLRGKDNLTAADYSVTAAFDNAKVGYKKTVIGKVTLNQTETAKNYVLTNDGNFSTDDGTITKAVAPTVQPVELTIYNGVQADYYVDLPSLPDMGKGKSYGTVGYRKTHTINLSEGYKAQSDLRADPENLNTLRLLLHMTQTGSLTGEIGTVTIPVTTSNYQDITLTVKISAKNRMENTTASIISGK